MQKVLELKNVSKIYSETKNITNFLSKNDDTFVAVDNVSFSLEAKKVLGLVGESGSGKSTCALMAMKLLDITEGEIFVNNNNITDLKLQELKQYRREMQIVFQDSYSSLDPMMTISKIIIDGGMTNNSFLMQLISNLSQKEISIPLFPDMSSYGSLLMGLIGSGKCKNLDELEQFRVESRSFFPPPRPLRSPSYPKP